MSRETKPPAFKPALQSQAAPPPPPASPARRTLVNNALLVMGATLLSRILGILREIVFANHFGTSAEAGAYRAAFRIPDTLYLLIVGGALGSALIPVFSRFLGQRDEEKAWRLANTVVNFSMVALLIGAGLAWLLAPFIVATVLAPGFEPAIKNLTVDLTRLLLLQPFFMGLGGIALALLNGSERFFWPAMAPLVYNISIIAGILFLTGPFGIQGVALGVVIGAALYLLVQLPALVRLGFYWRPGLDKAAPGAKQVLLTLGPRVLGQAAFMMNFFVATNLGSGLPEGASRVAAFENAYQLFMLPHGIFALSLATVAFPAMARLLGENNLAGMKETLTSSLRQVLFLTLPAALGLGLLARPIVQSLLQWGNFKEDSTELVSQTLFCFSFGLVSYGVVEIVTRGFYALHDTRTPVVVALLTVAVNLALSLALIGPLQQSGLSLALALSTTLEMALLIILLRLKIGPFELDDSGNLLLAIFKIVVAADAMGLGLFFATRLLQEPLENGGKVIILLLTGLLVAFGGAIYAGAAYMLGLEELRSVTRRFLRR